MAATFNDEYTAFLNKLTTPEAKEYFEELLGAPSTTLAALTIRDNSQNEAFKTYISMCTDEIKETWKEFQDIIPRFLSSPEPQQEIPCLSPAPPKNTPKRKFKFKKKLCELLPGFSHKSNTSLSSFTQSLSSELSTVPTTSPRVEQEPEKEEKFQPLTQDVAGKILAAYQSFLNGERFSTQNQYYYNEKEKRTYVTPIRQNYLKFNISSDFEAQLNQCFGEVLIERIQNKEVFTQPAMNELKKIASRENNEIFTFHFYIPYLDILKNAKEAEENKAKEIVPRNALKPTS